MVAPEPIPSHAMAAPQRPRPSHRKGHHALEPIPPHPMAAPQRRRPSHRKGHRVVAPEPIPSYLMEAPEPIPSYLMVAPERIMEAPEPMPSCLMEAPKRIMEAPEPIPSYLMEAPERIMEAPEPMPSYLMEAPKRIVEAPEPMPSYLMEAPKRIMEAPVPIPSYPIEGEEQAVLAAKVVQREVAEVSARSYKNGPARSYRAVQLESGESSRRAAAGKQTGPKRTISSWSKVEHLGSGSYGSVYKAISDDGDFFAVKEVSLMDIERIPQLQHEISLLSHFEHENIVQYFGTDEKDGKLYIFLELVTQGSLADLCRKCRLQDSQVSSYTRQILKGLQYLHEQKVLHRDIKGANILVDANGLVKLADFGLAKEISSFSQAKSCKGTVYWMAPEVARAKRHGPPADIWSLGCTVLEMLTGKRPYHGMEWQHAIYSIGKGNPPEIPNTLSKDARDFIEGCVKKKPNERPSLAQLFEHPFVQYGA